MYNKHRLTEANAQPPKSSWWSSAFARLNAWQACELCRAPIPFVSLVVRCSARDRCANCESSA